MKITQREKGTLPLPVMDPTGDLEVLARRVAALEALVGCLLWAVARREPRRPE